MLPLSQERPLKGTFKQNHSLNRAAFKRRGIRARPLWEECSEQIVKVSSLVTIRGVEIVRVESAVLAECQE